MDFGVVELSDKVSSTYYLGSGQNFTISPTVLQDGRLNLIVELDQRTNGGTQTYFESTNIQVLADRPVKVLFQPDGFIFTPKIKE